jgi:hypothetical protein
MKLEAGQGYLTEWYQNNDSAMVRDFVFRDFGNWLWTVKQFAQGADTTKVGDVKAYQSNPNSGETVLRDITGICNKALRKDSELYKELQFTHDCSCCN